MISLILIIILITNPCEFFYDFYGLCNGTYDKKLDVIIQQSYLISFSILFLSSSLGLTYLISKKY